MLGAITNPVSNNSADTLSGKIPGINDWFLLSIPRRICSVADAAYAVTAAVIDGVKGAVFTALSLVAFGQVQTLNRAAYRNLQESLALPSRLFRSAMRVVVNPGAEFARTPENGIVTSYFLSRLNKTQERLAQSDNLFASVIGSRAVSIIKIPAAINSRIVDLAIGLFAVIGAVLTLGFIERLNDAASNHLQILQVIPDIYRSAIEILNPQGLIANSTEPYHGPDGDSIVWDSNQQCWYEYRPDCGGSWKRATGPWPDSIRSKYAR